MRWSWLACFGAAVLSSGCADFTQRERLLAHGEAGLWEIRATAIHTGRLELVPFRVFREWSYGVYAKVSARHRGGAWRDLGTLSSSSHGDEDAADQSYDSAKVEICADASNERLAIEVTGAGVPQRLFVMYPFGEILAVRDAPPKASSCGSALTFAPDRDAWLAMELASVHGPDGRRDLLSIAAREAPDITYFELDVDAEAAFFGAANEGLRLPDALDHSLACVQTERSSFAPERELLVKAMSSGPQAASLQERYRERMSLAATPQPVVNPDIDWIYRLTDVLPLDARTLDSITSSVATCAQELSPECSWWRLAAYARVTKRQMDGPRCDSALGLIVPLLARTDQYRQDAAREILQQAGECGSAAAVHTAAIAILRHEPEETRGTDAACDVTGSSVQRAQCSSMYYEAAARLVASCDDEARAVAGEILTREAWAPASAGLCIIARCSGKEAYQRAFDPARFVGKTPPLSFCGALGW